MKKPKLEPSQEWVWDYPRPPRVEPTPKRLRVEFAGETIADSTSAVRVLETSHPPTYYIPLKDIRIEFVRPGSGHSFCEFKGRASYHDLVAHGRRSGNAAWGYARDFRY